MVIITGHKEHSRIENLNVVRESRSHLRIHSVHISNHRSTIPSTSFTTAAFRAQSAPSVHSTLLPASHLPSTPPSPHHSQTYHNSHRPKPHLYPPSPPPSKHSPPPLQPQNPHTQPPNPHPRPQPLSLPKTPPHNPLHPLPHSPQTNPHNIPINSRIQPNPTRPTLPYKRQYKISIGGRVLAPRIGEIGVGF